MIQELRGGIDDQIRFSSSTTQPTLLVRALNALIVDYFQQQKYEYTSSVFIPEANIHDHRVDKYNWEIWKRCHSILDHVWWRNSSIVKYFNWINFLQENRKIFNFRTFVFYFFLRNIQKSNAEIHGHASLLMSMLTCIASWLPGSSHSIATQTSQDYWAGSIAGSTLGSSLFLFDPNSSEFQIVFQMKNSTISMQCTPIVVTIWPRCIISQLKRNYYYFRRISNYERKKIFNNKYRSHSKSKTNHICLFFSKLDGSISRKWN